MIASHPAVDASCRSGQLYCRIGRGTKTQLKKQANRRHRRYLNRATFSFIKDPELFDAEGFDAPSLTSWDID